MKIEQIYTGCLAQGAYYITSNGEAAIIDPLRETKPYIDRITNDGVKLKYIFETHFHADFVSGHLDLSNLTDADIVYGPNANPNFKSIIAYDNQEFEIGDIKIKVLHTPGHTLESSTYLLIDEFGNDYCIFSGDTLFLGDVGRPDLAQKTGGITVEDLAGLLYESLINKIMPLPDNIIVYPAHGAGSACGKNMMKETLDTLGNQKRMNYALNQPDKETFIKAVTNGLLTPPGYFSMNVAMNKNGYNSFSNVLKKGLTGLSIDEFEQMIEFNNAIILDTRDSSEFSKCFIPNSINIGINGDFAPWVGTLISDVNQNIVLVTEIGKEEESVTRLARVGFDNQLGYLVGGINNWLENGKESDKVNRITANEFAENIKDKNELIIDVRKESEYETGHLINSSNKPLNEINNWINELKPNSHFYIHCAGGYRSMIASSILLSRGYRNFSEIEGGYSEILKSNLLEPIK